MRSNSLTFLFAMGVAAVACDLPPKSIGNETDAGTESNTSIASDSGDTGSDDTCVEGQTKMDDCNTCGCLDGHWACTAIGCDATETGTPDECLDGDTRQQDCNDCSCIDGLWACTDAVCEPDGVLDVCGPEVPRDEFFVNDASISGDILTVDLSHGGGCEMHVFDGCWDGAFNLSDPPQAGMFVSHDANGDQCEAEITQKVEVDLSPMRLAYQEGQESANGTIEIRLEGWDQTLVYEF